MPGHLIGSHCGYAVGNAELVYGLELDDTGLKIASWSQLYGGGKT